MRKLAPQAQDVPASLLGGKRRAMLVSPRGFGHSPHRTSDELNPCSSPPARLTAAVLPRQLVDAQIKKRLAQKLGRGVATRESRDRTTPLKASEPDVR